MVGFFKSKGHNSVKYFSMKTKTQLDLDIVMGNLYAEFHFNMCNLCEEIEWEQKIGQLTYRQTAAKQYTLPFSKRGIKILKIFN